MSDYYKSQVDEDYQDEVYFVFNGMRSTQGCICNYKYGCRCAVMILPVED